MRWHHREEKDDIWRHFLQGAKHKAVMTRRRLGNRAEIHYDKEEKNANQNDVEGAEEVKDNDDDDEEEVTRPS